MSGARIEPSGELLPPLNVFGVLRGGIRLLLMA